MTKKEKQYLYDITVTLNVLQDCLFDISKRLEELEKKGKDNENNNH
tara:strand:+ start:88 stop:225 length:138 start_codon:yes stop_codon:yes gene_type:complete